MNAKKPRSYCAAGCGLRCKTFVAKYCSLNCEHVDQFRRRSQLLERGLYPPCQSNSQFIRRYLALKIGERCSRCGWCERRPVTGRVMVEVEHIDGNWQNNSPANLTFLCPNCHSLTATFRALNRGRGRPGRRLEAPDRPRTRKEWPPAAVELADERQLRFLESAPT